jgi:hypothetical protein
MRRCFALIMAAAIVSVTVLPGVARDESTTTPPTRSLYARLGGYDFVATCTPDLGSRTRTGRCSSAS